ncbi:MAG: transglycosylase SLT domain-containing protein [bacterium]|nr:transglycosylase SLT domain-containing protein [bacterium]
MITQIIKERLHRLKRLNLCNRLKEICVINFLISFIFLPVGSADQILLQSGQKIEGVILSEHEPNIRIQTAVSVIAIPRAQIVSIQHESPASGYLRLAETLAKDSQYTAALPFYLRSLQYQPNNIAVQDKVRRIQFLQVRKSELAKLDSLLAEQQFAPAIQLYQQVLQVHNDKPYAPELKAELATIYVRYAQYYYNHYFTEGVLKNLREAYRLDPNCKEVHRLLALIQRDDGLEVMANWEQEKSYELALAQNEQEQIIAEAISATVEDSGPDLPSSAFWDELRRLAAIEAATTKEETKLAQVQPSFTGRISKWLHLLLQAYNAGPKAVVVYDGRVPYQETRDYVFRVNRWLVSSPPDNGFDQWINQHAKTHGLDPQLVKAIIKTESNFNPKARSNKNARGLMQLTPQAWNDMVALLGVNWSFTKSAYEPEKNIAVGCRYLAWLKNQFLPKYFDMQS